MRLPIRTGYLAVTRAGRTTQYKLPRGIHVLYAALIVTVIFFLAHPVVTSLTGQAAAGLDAGKLSEAAGICFGGIAAEAANMAFASPPPLTSPLPEFRLQLPNNTLLKMQTALASGDPALKHESGGHKPYFKALLEHGGTSQQVKVCLRGAMHWHHRPEKPSFRIKLQKDEVEQGDRYIELTTPEDALALINWLPVQLANHLELMVDHSRHVRLFVNNRYFGVYVQSARLGEPFALANQRMPGTFFKAEFSDGMWDSADKWSLFGQQDAEDKVVLQQWLDLLKGAADAPNLQRMQTILDVEKFARWAALMTVAGSIHTDDRHNHSYFLCSNQGKLEPLPWDCNGYGVHLQPDSPVDVQVQPLLRFLSFDPRWVHRRNQWIHQLINGPASIGSITSTIDSSIENMRGDLQSDRNLGNLKKFTGAGWNWIPVSVASIDSQRRELLAWIGLRNRFLKDYLSDVRFALQPQADGGCTVHVFGSVAVEAVDRQSGDVFLFYPGLSRRPAVHTSHQQQAEIRFQYLVPALQTYRLEKDCGQLQFRNAITGVSVSPLEISEEQMATIASPRTVSASQFEQPLTSNVVLGPGRVEVDRDLIVGPRQTLTVCAGTTLLLGPRVGIYSRGRTHFAGTASAPILVRGSQSEPWAAIGIAGEQTSGSVLEHVDAAGGSTGKLDEIRFKGMVNAYDCPDIRLSHCRFGRNYLGDDTVNLAESMIRVENCQWHDASSDALDLDMCQGTIADCDWTDSGNDGLDLMSCHVKVSRCRFSGSADKGISVGENSRLTVRDSIMARCSRGTEIKDDSVAEFSGCIICACRTAVHSYQKKWFYSGGGHSAFVNCQIYGNEDSDLDIESKSEVILVNTSAKIADSQARRVSRLVSLPDDWGALLRPAAYQPWPEVD